MAPTVRSVIILASLLQIYTSFAQAAFHPGISRRADIPTDPFQLRAPGTPVTLVFSGWSNPDIHFTPLQLFDIAQSAQYEILQQVVHAKGDARVAQPNFQWCSSHGMRRICLRFNHNIDDGLTWTMLSAAVKGMVAYGWETSFSLCKRISILEDEAGVVANGELVFDGLTTS